MQRNRLLYLVAIIAVIPLGLAIRRSPAAFPALVAEYGGDTLWALMIFLGIGLLQPKMPTLKAAAIALALCYVIEFSQLSDAPWLVQLRHATYGLVLGYGFMWSDIVCYTVGVSLGTAAELHWTYRWKPSRSSC